MNLFTPSFLAIAVAVVALGSGSARAQDSVELRLGARVRVRSDSIASWQYGRFGGRVADSILLHRRGDDAPRRIAIGALRELDVRESNRPAKRSNAILGAILGLASGAVASDLSVRLCERRHPHSDGPPCAIGYGLLPVVAVGAGVVGGFVGYAWPANRWQPVVLVSPR